MQKIFAGIGILIVGVVIGCLLPDHYDYRDEGKWVQVNTIIDTVIFRDTIREVEPVESIKEYWYSEKVVVRDTLRICDTLYVNLPMKKVCYKGEDYYAEVSGYNPNLDYIEVYPKTVKLVETKKIKEKLNYLSLGAEANYALTPYIPIYLQYERMLHKNASFYVRALYDIPSNSYGAGIGVKLTVGW